MAIIIYIELSSAEKEKNQNRIFLTQTENIHSFVRMRKQLIVIVSNIVLLVCVQPTIGQSLYQPYSHAFYQKLSPVLYSPDTRLHTAFKPMIVDSTLATDFNNIVNLHGDHRTSWGGRKLWQEHLIELDYGKNTFYADLLPDFQMGRSTREDKSIWIFSKGIQIGGKIGGKLAFQANYFHNQAQFADYINDYVEQHGVVPGEAGTVHNNGSQRRWSNATANLSFTPIHYLNISLAYDKNFIGDGYRSLLLSDVSANYLSLKLTGTLGNVQYVSLLSYMRDPFATTFENTVSLSEVPNNGAGANRFKWGAFQYLDWNITNRFSAGFFQSVIWAPKNSAGRRGFDFNYISPLIFLRSVELTNTSSPDKMHLGINTKYKVLDNMAVYGQFLLGELTIRQLFAGNGYLHNKFGIQLGARGHDLFGIKKLNYLGEFNTVRPYTYQHFTPITAYTNYSQPLAHPLGANFREGIALLNYSFRSFDFQAQGVWAMYGSDPDANTNYGGDIFKYYTQYPSEFGNTIGQGVNTHLVYLGFKAAYLLNPKYNLRIELAATNRRAWDIGSTNNTSLFSIGLRSSFRNQYHDF